MPPLLAGGGIGTSGVLCYPMGSGNMALVTERASRKATAMYVTAGPVPNAKLVRATLKAAGLLDLVAQVTSGRQSTYVRLVWDRSSDEKAAAIVAALRPLWIDGKDRVWKAYAGCVVISRRGLHRWVPDQVTEVAAIAVNGASRLLVTFAEGPATTVTADQMASALRRGTWTITAEAETQADAIRDATITEVTNVVGGGWRRITFGSGLTTSVTLREIAAKLADGRWAITGQALAQAEKLNRELAVR